MTENKEVLRTNTKESISMMTKEQAQKLVEAETLKAHEAFKKGYIKLCEEHGLQLVSFPTYTLDGRTVTQQTVGDYELQG